MVEYKGTYDRTGAENYDEFLKALDVNFVLRKAATASSPVFTVTEEDGTWTFKTATVLKSMELKFKLDEEFEETTPDGREVKAIVKKDGDKFISIQTAKKEGQKSTEVIREFFEDKCVQTMKVKDNEGKEVVCVQTFTRRAA